MAEELGHEITHVVQEKVLGPVQYNARYAREERTYGMRRYNVPSTLVRTPIGNLDPVDARFTLDAIATRVEDEVLNTLQNMRTQGRAP